MRDAAEVFTPCRRAFFWLTNPVYSSVLYSTILYIRDSVTPD